MYKPKIAIKNLLPLICQQDTSNESTRVCSSHKTRRHIYQIQQRSNTQAQIGDTLAHFLTIHPFSPSPSLRHWESRSADQPHWLQTLGSFCSLLRSRCSRSLQASETFLPPERMGGSLCPTLIHTHTLAQSCPNARHPNSAACPPPTTG